MKTILFLSLMICGMLAYASALPAAEDLESQQAPTLTQPAGAAVAADDDVLEGAEQRWGRGGWGGGWGGRGWGGGGWGGGWGGRGWGGGGWGGRGWGGGWGGRGWGGRGWGR